jgi:predicted outer membrane repeat protein
MRNLSAIFNTWAAGLGIRRKKKHLGPRKSYRRELRFEEMEDRRMLATFHVTTNADAPVNTPAAVGTLRQAIQDANNQPGADTIDFASNLNNATITLTQGELAISESVTIDGRDSNQVSRNITIAAYDPTPTTDNGDGTHIFSIDDPSSGSSPPLVQLIGLTLTGADVADFGGAIGWTNGILSGSSGELIVQHCTFEGNHADYGGAISINVAGSGSTPRDVLTIEDSSFDGNSSSYGGGAVFIFSSSAPYDSFTINRSTFHGNNGTTLGGAIFAELTGNQLSLEGTTIDNENTATYGGGIDVGADGRGITGGTVVQVINSHIDHHIGGGIRVGGHDLNLSILEESTISDNELGSGVTAGLFGGHALINSSTISGTAAYPLQLENTEREVASNSTSTTARPSPLRNPQLRITCRQLTEVECTRHCLSI